MKGEVDGEVLGLNIQGMENGDLLKREDLSLRKGGASKTWMAVAPGKYDAKQRQ